ncbi:MAG: DUF5633 domain-containing protein [Finegoldia magna]|nr:DUF5633 domain-containing protein [Finegoldia magna]
MKAEGRRQIPPIKGSFHCHINMKFNKKLLVAVLAATMTLGSGVSAYATADNTDTAKKQQEEVSVQIIKEILDNVDKILEKLEKDPDLTKLEKDPELKKQGKISEVEKLKKDVKKERAVLDMPTGLTTKYAIGMLRHFDEAIAKIKQLKAQPEFDTKEKAEEAAKKDLETELVKNAFDIKEKDGKYHYTLKFKNIEPEKSTNSDPKQKTDEKKTEKDKKIDGLKNSAEKQKAEEAKKKAEEEKKEAEAKEAEEEKKKAEEAKKAEEEKKSEEMKAEAKKKAEEFKKNAEKKKITLVRKSEKVNTTTSDNKVSRPVKTTADKKKLPKAGSEAEILTLATASLAGVLGVYTSIKKRK